MLISKIILARFTIVDSQNFIHVMLGQCFLNRANGSPMVNEISVPNFLYLLTTCICLSFFHP